MYNTVRSKDDSYQHVILAEETLDTKLKARLMKTPKSHRKKYNKKPCYMKHIQSALPIHLGIHI